MSRTASPERTVSEPDIRAVVRICGHRVGRLVGWDDGSGPLVDYPGNPHGPLAARTVIPLTEVGCKGAMAENREVLLVFEAERSDRPIVNGLLEATSTSSGFLAPEVDARVDG